MVLEPQEQRDISGSQESKGEASRRDPHAHGWRHLRGRYPQAILVAQSFLDFGTVLAGNSLAYALYLWLDIGKRDIDPGFYWTLNVLASLGMVLVFASVGLYKETQGIANIEETWRLVKGVFYGFLAIFVISFFIRERQYSRITAILAVPINLALLSVQRALLSKIYAVLHMRGVGVRRCLIYGAGETGLAVARRLFQSRQMGWLPVGFLDDDPAKAGKAYRGTAGPNGVRLRVLGKWEDFPGLVRDFQVSDFLVAVPSDHTHQVLERARAGCERLGIQYHFVPSAGGLFLPSLEFRDLDGIPLFSPRADAHLIFYDAAKRAFDLLVSCVVLGLSSPLFLLVAAAIRLESPGPIIFRQRRVGRGGKEFLLFKFRTMLADTEPYASTPCSRGDPRITRVGRLLRRLSLDELPQLLNVVKGEMSLVGPRPEMPFIAAGYNERQRQRLKVKPGITGLWQISEDRAFQIHENIEYDLYYIENRSFFLDLAILFQTAFSAFRGVGAW